jgi:hypothetical protein
MFSANRSCVAPTRIECPLTCATSPAGILIHFATRLNACAIVDAQSLCDPPTAGREIFRRASTDHAPEHGSLVISAASSHSLR